MDKIERDFNLRLVLRPLERLIYTIETTQISSSAKSGLQPSEQRGSRLERLRRAIGFAFPYRRAVGGLFAITVVMAMINAGEPLVLKY